MKNFIEAITDKSRVKACEKLLEAAQEAAQKLGVECVDDQGKIEIINREDNEKSEISYASCVCYETGDKDLEQKIFSENLFTEEDVELIKKFKEQNSDKDLILMSNGAFYEVTRSGDYEFRYVCSVGSLWKDVDGIVHTEDIVVPQGLDYEVIVDHGMPRLLGEVLISYDVTGKEGAQYLRTGVYADAAKCNFFQRMLDTGITVDDEIDL